MTMIPCDGVRYRLYVNENYDEDTARARAKRVSRRRRLALRPHTCKVTSVMIVRRLAETVEGVGVFL